MKKSLLTLFFLFALVACSESSPDTAEEIKKEEIRTAEPQRSEMDELTLAYIKLDNGTVSCKHKIIDDKYPFAACQFIAIGSKSVPQIWYYDHQKDAQKRFYAFTGNARTTYEKHLSGNPILGDYAETFGLPVPEDMEMDKITQAFQ